MTSTLKAFVGLTALTFAGLAIAATEIDTDGDGVYSMEELKAAYPDLSEDILSAVDTDTDGSVSEAELLAAIEAGVLPAAATDG